jgi:hypothetical protein
LTLITTAFLAVVVAGSAGAAGETVTVTGGNTNLIDGSTVTVNVTTTGATGAGVFVAVTQCGNANTAGVPFVAPPGQNDCEGQDGLGSSLQLLGFPAGNLAAGVHSTPLLLKQTGIGSNGATCVPSPPAAIPCTITAATATTGGSYTGPGYNFQAAAVITYKPPVSASVSSVTGQSGTAAARSGNTVNLTGSNWDDAATISGTLCDNAGANCSDGFGGTFTASSSGGTLTASGTVDGSATAGAHKIKVTQSSDGQFKLVPIQILGARTVSLNLTTGGPGTTVQVTGHNFDANVPVGVAGLQATLVDPTSDTPSGGLTNDTGDATVSFTVNDPATAYISMFEASSPATTAAFTGFTFSALSCIPAGQTEVPGDATTGGPGTAVGNGDGCSLVQTIQLSVSGGKLSFAEAGGTVVMDDITLNGSDQTSGGNIQKLTVTDPRGSLAGWTVISTLTDITDGTSTTNHVIPASKMSASGITCAPQSASTGNAAEATAGGGGAFDTVTPLTLCTAGAGGGGGTFDIDAVLSLLVPASVHAGSYTGTMTFLIT